MHTLTITVPRERWDRIKKRLDSLKSRSSGYDKGEIQYTVLKSEIRYEGFRAGQFDTVEISAEPLKVESGASVLGMIFFDGDSTRLWRFPTGESVKLETRFDDPEPFCQHCDTKRYRRKMFIVEMDDGSQRLVGTTCLLEYTGLDPTVILSRASFWESLEEEKRESSWSSSAFFGFDARYVVSLAAKHIREGGFEAGGPTAVLVHRSALRGEDVELDTELHQAMLRHFEVRAEENRSGLRDYDRNVTSALKAEVICTYAQYALLTSAVHVYNKAKTRKPAVKKESVPECRQVIEGEIISIKSQPGFRGTEWKMLLDCGPYRLYGSIPRALDTVKTGQRIRMVASLLPKESGFGFFKRPTKAEVLEMAS